jgi:EAL and modified HD-GYP domain-containing signal transduction protein
MHAEVPAVKTPPSDEFFLARQPILGRDQNLFAYELLFRAAGEHEDANITDSAAATAAVISHASQLGMEHVVGEQMAFVNVDEVVLHSDFVRFLSPHKVILEILETVRPTADLLARVIELKNLGFRFALDDVIAFSPDVDSLVALVDIIKVDIQGVAPAELASLTQALRRPRKKLLAEKVETQEEFNLCLELGFDYFQGYHFARPSMLSGKKIAPSSVAILALLDLLKSQADDRTIETAVKRDALVSLNLLRLVNSRAARPGQRIESLAQALQLLGRRELQRWLQILVYATPGSTVELKSPLLQLASTRGKMLELMSLKTAPDDAAGADTAFTVGIMSLTEAMLSVPMADVLENVDVADEVRSALIDRTGKLGQMLRVAEILEHDVELRPLNAALKKLGLTFKEIRDIELAAFNWVRELAVEAD